MFPSIVRHRGELVIVNQRERARLPTTSDDVTWMLDTIAVCRDVPIIAGGWGVDALLGEQTHEHHDLDVLLDHRAIKRAVELFHDEGFTVTTDWLPVRIELSDIDDDRHIDLHPIHEDGRSGFWQHGLDGARFDYPVEVVAKGVIGGRTVRCLSAVKQIALHTGYEFRDVDHHDIANLSKITKPDNGN